MFYERLLVYRVVLTDEREDQLRTTFAVLGPEAQQALDVRDDLVVLQSKTRGLEYFFARRVDADVDGVEPRLNHSARNRLSDQRSIADQSDFTNALLLCVSDLLDQLAIDERLAVVVHSHMG